MKKIIPYSVKLDIVIDEKKGDCYLSKVETRERSKQTFPSAYQASRAATKPENIQWQ